MCYTLCRLDDLAERCASAIHQRRLVWTALLQDRAGHVIEEDADFLAAAFVLVEEAQHLAHLVRVLILAEHALLVEVVLDRLALAAECVEVFDGVRDSLSCVVLIRLTILDGKVDAGKSRGRTHQAARDIADIVIRTLSHLVNEAVVVVGQREQGTLDALDAVCVDVAVLVSVSIALVLADDTVEHTGHKVLICRRRQVALLVIDVRIEVTRLDFLRVCLRLLACTHAGTASCTADDILHRVRVDIVNDFADEHILAQLREA